MKQHGRKSSASLAVIVPQNKRVDPPVDLPDNQREIWLRVVQNRPIDWFKEEHLDMLRCYCRHMAYANTLAAGLDEVKPEWLADADRLRDYDRLYGMHERETRAVAQWATRMRLTQQSVDQRVASRKLENFEPGNKPWQQKTA